MSAHSLTSPEPTSADFAVMFESAPISLWLEDYSDLKTLFDEWRTQGVQDLRAHLKQHPHLLARCSRCFKVLKVNRRTLELFAASSQDELISRMGEVFRDDMFGNLANELDLLWNGKLQFSNQSVNYALDGRRLDVQIHMQVLAGHETRWDRLLVSLEDISARVAAERKSQLDEQYALGLFEHSPVSLWVEDFSQVKALLDEVREQGISDLRTFINVHPEFVDRCAEAIRVLDVNQQTLSMFAARDKDELMGSLGLVFRDEMHRSFTEQLLDLWVGRLNQMREVVNYSLNGSTIHIHMQFCVMKGHEAQWDMVLVSLVDITARKKAEAYLEYLGKHDSLTKLRNRVYYLEELNRISRRGPWPLGVVAIDLNGLKRANDADGHAAGDALLRRAGEVLTNATSGSNHCVARVGGDEFIVLMPGADERATQALEARIVSTLELDNQFNKGRTLSMAMGCAIAINAGSVEAATHAADMKMLAAKEAFYTSVNIDRRRHGG